MRKVLVLGATSAIAAHAARFFAADGDEFMLIGRSPEKLQAVRDDLITRGASRVEWLSRDLTDCSLHDKLVEQVCGDFGVPDVTLVAWGVLPDQAACEHSIQATISAIHANFSSVASVLTPLSLRLEEKKSGTICVISSVAGDRGRQSNYVYGSAKAGLSAYLQGLRARLCKSGVHVITVKPGFVDTPMTAAIPKNALFASAESVGRGIYKGVLGNRNVIYLPVFWMLIMFVIKHIPEAIFKKLKL